MSTTAGFLFENVEHVDGDRRVAGKHGGERFRGVDHDAESEVHALRPREERRVWCRKVESGVEIGDSGAECRVSLAKRYRQKVCRSCHDFHG